LPACSNIRFGETLYFFFLLFAEPFSLSFYDLWFFIYLQLFCLTLLGGKPQIPTFLYEDRMGNEKSVPMTTENVVTYDFILLILFFLLIEFIYLFIYYSINGK
jgi:hypothetical protein